MAYNAAGSVLTTSDPVGHSNTITYSADYAYAYPTTITDADNFSSTIQYNFDRGVKTRVEGPPPQNQPNGVIQLFEYDNALRINEVTTQNTGAYTKYEYGADYIQTLSSVNSLADEAFTFTLFNGLGQVFISGGNHPGSSGGYKAQTTYYDRMGRVLKQSNPTEIDGSWTPAGDDVLNAQADTGGWRFTQQTYDWKGRPLARRIRTALTKKRVNSGCGCAGGEVVTLTDEGNLVNGVTKVRQQRIYSDVLGRSWKTEVLTQPGPFQTDAGQRLAADQLIEGQRKLFGYRYWRSTRQG